MQNSFITNSFEETLNLGKELGPKLQKGSILAFFGDLASGKTALIKGIVSSITGLSPECISSPTFNYLNIYEGSKTVYHFDLYRIEGEKEFLDMGLDEYLYEDGICCIEWAERVRSLLYEDTIYIHTKHLGREKREIKIEPIYEKICL